ncbi:hypothetical protein CFB82_38855 [Burkholderia sp. HI2714]|nr:hypothetical protein CFB82_38855 [Burkholderia sp. HI2714]
MFAQPHGVPAIAPALQDGKAAELGSVGQVGPCLTHVGGIRIDADFFTVEPGRALHDLIAVPRAVKADIGRDTARHAASYRAQMNRLQLVRKRLGWASPPFARA